MNGQNVEPYADMAEDLIEKHQLAGVDDQERGFSRPVTLQQSGNVYRATLQYERTLLTGESAETREGAIGDLIRTLHERGYRQLRSQLSFRGTEYLGSQQPWVEYLDPVCVASRVTGIADLVGRVMRLFGRSG